MWYDAEDRRPLWDPPQVPEFGLPDSYMLSPDLRHIWRNLKMRPQYIVENTVDISHQKWVHHSPSEHELIEWEIDGAMCRTRQTITFGVGKAKTWLTPNGPVAGLLDVECWGVGFNVARFLGTDDAAHVASHTPTDEHHLDERLTVVTRIEPGNEDAPSPLALKRFATSLKAGARARTVLRGGTRHRRTRGTPRAGSKLMMWSSLEQEPPPNT